MDDTTALTAAVKRKRDGDGDGFVDDGTPLERPVIPGFDLVVENGVERLATSVDTPVGRRVSRPKGGNPQKVADTVAVKRNRVGNVDTDRLRRRRRRLITEIDDDGVFYPSGRHGFAMRAAELTVIESELERRGELARKDRYTATIKPDPAPEPTPKRTVYHLTDAAQFKLNPKKVPADNALAINERTAPGLYVAKDRRGVEAWVNGYGYLRPFVVELDVPEDVLTDERWGNEGFIPAEHFDKVEVKRVIPTDAFARETYNDYGWVETELGSRFDDGMPVPERRFGEAYEGLPAGWRYEGPDVRDMAPAEVKRLKDGARIARRSRSSGKEARSNPFAPVDGGGGELEGETNPTALTDSDGELGEGSAAEVAPIRVLRRANIANVGEQHRKVAEDWDVSFPVDDWTPYIPELDSGTLFWAMSGGNLTGLAGLDHDDDTGEILSMSVSAERLLRHMGMYGHASGSLNDDEYAFHMENVWLHLTQTFSARRALSRAAHDGPTSADSDFYRFVHRWFRQVSVEGTAATNDTVPVRRYFLRDWADTPEDAYLPDDPFAPGTRWKEESERPNAPGSGLTSWTSYPNRADFGYPISRFAGDENGLPYWEGDVLKSQVLGRFGDVGNEVIVARDPEILDRLLGRDEAPNPFTPADGDGELESAVLDAPPVDPVLTGLLTQRGANVDPGEVDAAWRTAMADPDDLDAIRAALSAEATRKWGQVYGPDATSAMRSGKGGVPPLAEVLAHNARRVRDAVPLERDNLGVNGMPSAAEIVEHDPELADWLGVSERTTFGQLRQAIRRRPLADLLSDPDPPAEGVRYLQMLRRAARRDVGRMGGSVELHRTNTQGTDSPFETRGGSGLTSWTTDYATAAKYAKGLADTVTVDVSADRILAYDTYGIMASTGFWDFAGQDSYPLPGREVLVTSPEVLDRLDAGVFPLLPSAAAGDAPATPMVAAMEGDGDGFVFDGTPRMRPFNPLTDLGGGRFAVGFKGQARPAPPSRPDSPFVPVDGDGQTLGLAAAVELAPGFRLPTDADRERLKVSGRPIPPGWSDVQVAIDPDAPMQVRARDSKGRAKYIYSAAHEAGAAAAKYERAKAVAARLPRLDAALERDAMDDPTAAATTLIRHFGLRPGSMKDTKARKKAYGATTLQARHVKQYPDTGRTTLSFMGKSGQKITVSTRDADIYELMERWTAGKSGTDRLFDTTEGRVLLYVKEHLGEEFKTKDLRTVLANTMALDMVSTMRRPTTLAKFKAARNKVADAVAKALGNTRAVSLRDYIDPTVFAVWEGALPA